MKKLLALLLALVMIFATMTFLTACGEDETSSDDKKGDETKDDGKNDGDDNEDEGTALHGLYFDIPSSYEVNEYEDDLTLKKDGIRIDITYEDAPYDSAEEAAEAYASAMAKFAENTVTSSSENDVHYVIVQEEGKDSVKIVAYYMDGDHQWRMNATVEDFENNKDEVIAILTSATKK